ncbi:MAG: hypothetical protein ACE15C_17240 [Phycisphaerae bacterium]
MKPIAHSVRWYTLGLFLAAFTSLACTDSNLSKQADSAAETRGLIVGLEGLQPFSGNSIDSLTKEVAAYTHLAQESSSGFYWTHMPAIRAAHAAGKPIYIVGYSLGGIDATRLAQECRKANITVSILFLLDPGALCAFSEKIPPNVRKVVFYQSGSCDSVLDRPQQFLEDPGSTRVELEDLSYMDHLGLPSVLADRIEGDILRGP